MGLLAPADSLDLTDLTDPPDPSGPPGPSGLPDLLGLDLAALRTLDHPVLAAVVADLRGRAEQPREMLWGFNNAF
ncbi:FXSXX-COOH protein [Streptomyces paludis]|uniref:FXSXX-COOH protein n=2 Tax=Streptomyces paludis TaxID=2282738 RepID=A0A345I1N8_9ACTN|nr:FXSXX-COOH protein [Streptomyces paludis]